jgi:hypothetical protein
LNGRHTRDWKFGFDENFAKVWLCALVVPFRSDPNVSPCKQLKAEVAAVYGVQAKKLTFEFDGDNLADNDTARGLGMEHDFMIDVKVRYLSGCVVGTDGVTDQLCFDIDPQSGGGILYRPKNRSCCAISHVTAVVFNAVPTAGPASVLVSFTPDKACPSVWRPMFKYLTLLLVEEAARIPMLPVVRLDKPELLTSLASERILSRSADISPVFPGVPPRVLECSACCSGVAADPEDSPLT